MLRKFILFTAVLSVLVITSSSAKRSQVDILIYGGGPQAVSAALTASDSSGGRAEILLIVPEPQLGSILTVGKQNLFDLNYYKPKKLPEGLPDSYKGAQAGSLYRFVEEVGAVFPPEALARHLADQIAKHPNIRVLYETDLTEVKTASQGSGGTFEIEAVRFRKMKKGPEGRYRFAGEDSALLRADIFIDASESGRLLRLSKARYTVGREDQTGDRTQMTATLMYKLRGADAFAAVKPNMQAYGVAYSHKGSFQFWAGAEAYKIPEIIQYDKNNPHFRLKAYNAGEDGYSHVGADTSRTEFWMNHLIIYEVDALKAWRDQLADNGMYSKENGLDPEVAREMAIAELKKPEYWQMIRKLPGLEKAEPVLKNGEPMVGDILYIRESIHAANRPTDPKPHALTKQDVLNGGEHLYGRRIGVGFYNFDSNTYKKDESLSNPLHAPWYVPYETLLSPEVTNLLIPGYAANIDSYAWTAMRVYPNLIMLGDAAGTAAGLAYGKKLELAHPDEAQLKLLQDRLTAIQAILEK